MQGEMIVNKLFAPDYYIRTYRDLNLERLKQRNIKVLVCDIDNTLVAGSFTLRKAGDNHFEA